MASVAADVVSVMSVANVPELLRVVWMEVAIASFAATVYFSLTGYLATPGKKAKSLNNTERKPSGRAADQEPSTYQLVTKALRQGKVSNAIALMQQLPEMLAGAVPASLAPRLLMAAAKATDLEALKADLSAFAGKIEARSLEAVVMEAVKNKDFAACRQLQVIACELSIPKSQQTLEAFAKGLADATCLRMLVDEVEAPLAKSFAKAVLEACTVLKDVDLAAEIFEKVAEADMPALRDAVEKAAANPPASVATDASTAKDAAVPAKEIRACGKGKDLAGAIKIFEEQERKNSVTSLLYNSVMDACVECGSVDKAMEYFRQASSGGLADIVSYNTAMKGFLAQGKVKEARGLFAELTAKGLTPSIASYHGLLNFHVNARDCAAAWKVVAEMQEADVKPTNITCSILLKGIITQADIKKVCVIVDTIEPIDEVLFHSLAEACIRTGMLHLLAKYQSKLAGQGSSVALTAPTYGSMIKAYGQSRDVKRVKDLWSDMISQKVQPTAVTLGCMVEALVANRCTVEAWKLVQQMRGDESTRPLVNTVIYSTILKGFAMAKDTAKVMALYEEMKVEAVQPNNITYNTILNAFAHNGAMDRVPALLQDMKTAVPPAEPDIVTYSTIVKGFCNSGSLDKALQILKDMQTDGKLTPDEMLYNSLLDGCAKEHRPNDALKLLDDMMKSGVAPSNYTLSMLVKLMGRCRRLNQAFSIIEDISRKYGVKVNIQVYTCLIQACFNNRQAGKAVALHEQMVKEGLVPDEMVYSTLVQGCLRAGIVDKAVMLTRCAHGLALPKFKKTPPGVNARCRDELIAALGGTKSAEATALMAEIAKGPQDSSPRSQGGAPPPWRK